MLKRTPSVVEKSVKMNSVVDVKQFINERPMSKYQWLVLAICFLIVAVDGMDVAIMGFIAPAVISEWQISKAAFGVVMSAAPLGLVIGALVAGPLSDRVGRKKVLVVSVLTFGVFTLLTALTQHTTDMALLRLMTGVGLGAAMPNASTLLTEYVPERSRSFLVTIMFTGFNLGSAMVGFAAAAIIPSHGWRAVLFVGGALPLLLVPVIIWLLPESCRYMAVKGGHSAKIAAVLKRVSGQSLDEGTSFISPEQHASEKAPVKQLMAKGFALMSVSLWVTYFMGLMVIYLLTGWLPTLFKENGLSITDAANITAMFQLGGTVGAVLVGWLMDRFAPTKVISFAYAGGAVAVMALGMSGTAHGTLAFWVLLAGFCMSGAQTGLNAYAPSCYPTTSRATGVSWMLGMGRFGSILGSLVGGILLGLGWGFGTVLGMLAVPALVAALAIVGSRRQQAAAA
jgi:AAHS family 4-hydroxybenzoate transporter-like MFS transporter